MFNAVIRTFQPRKNLGCTKQSSRCFGTIIVCSDVILSTYPTYVTIGIPISRRTRHRTSMKAG